MPENKGWLEKVLDEASADVKSWPEWLRDKRMEGRSEGTSDVRQASPVKCEPQSSTTGESLD